MKTGVLCNKYLYGEKGLSNSTSVILMKNMFILFGRNDPFILSVQNVEWLCSFHSFDATRFVKNSFKNIFDDLTNCNLFFNSQIKC